MLLYQSALTLRCSVNTHTNTGGLELYFVNQIVKTASNDEKTTIGCHDVGGMVISAEGTAVTIAHEVGHAFGMRDIYIDRNGVEIDHAERIRRSVLPGDWSGGCDGEGDGGTRYYKSGRRLCDIIRAMLMDGCKDDASQGRDITFGSVSGIDLSDVRHDVMTGFFDNVGHRSNPVNE